MPILFVLLMLLTPLVQAEDNPLQPLKFLIGEWTGVENASFGNGKGTRRYRMILQDRYLLSENSSLFEPQQGLPEGDHHEDWTIFSYDTDRQRIVVRQFNSEGFVNRFVLDGSSTAPGKWIFISEAAENAPGLRARLTYEKVNNDQLRELFELAQPGKDFAVLVSNVWDRVR